MTNKQFEVKEYLSSLRFAEKMIEIKLEKIEETRDLALRVNQALNPVKVQGGQRKNIVEEVAIKVAGLTQQLEKQVDEYKELQNNVFELISEIPNKVQQEILELRYIHFMKWEDIVKNVSYESRYVLKLHMRALDIISKSEKFKKISFEKDTKRHFKTPIDVV